MAVDKKSDYYTSPDNYKDLDGNIKSFTYIDHDKKPKFAFGGKETDFQREWRELEEFITPYLSIQAVTTYLADNDLIWGEINLGELRKLKNFIENVRNRLQNEPTG